MKKSICLIYFLLISAVYAETIQFSLTANGPDTSTKTLASVNNQVTEAQDWVMEYEHDLILIPNDGLVVPIELQKPTITLINDQQGLLELSDDGVFAVTRTPAIAYNHTADASFTMRPTLFISIGGFSPELDTDGHRVDPWQYEMDKQLRTVLGDYEYKHFIVNWDSHKTNRNQVKRLAKVVNRFLNNRAVPWDVVIVGFSRGGIFAHELTKKIVGHSKIKNLHTFLLDPTATSIFGDFYPAKIQEQSPTKHYGSLYYDGEPLINVSGLGTVGDMPITGYDNYGTHPHLFPCIEHQYFGGNWIDANNNGFLAALADIKAKKDTGTFLPELESSGSEVVKISASTGVVFDGSMTFTDGNLHINGYFSYNDLPSSSVFVDLMAGQDGVAVVYGASGVSAYQLILDKDSLELSESILFTNYKASITSDGITADMNIDSIQVGGHVGLDGGNVTISVGGDTLIKIDTGEVDSVDKAVNKVKKWFGF